MSMQPFFSIVARPRLRWNVGPEMQAVKKQTGRKT
jgi:hypothetical protein